MHDPYRHYLHGKEGSRYRGSEEGRKDGRHSAHGNGIPVIIIKSEELAHVLPQGAPDLQGRPLPADRGAGEVGEDSGNKYQQGEPQGDHVSGVDGVEDQVRPDGFLKAHAAVEEDNRAAPDGKQKEKIRVGHPGCSRQSHALVEYSANYPAQKAH